MIVEEEDGSRWTDFEVGDRSEDTFLRLYNRLPDAARYVSDGYSEANRNLVLRSKLRSWWSRGAAALDASL